MSKIPFSKIFHSLPNRFPHPGTQVRRNLPEMKAVRPLPLPVSNGYQNNIGSLFTVQYLCLEPSISSSQIRILCGKGLAHMYNDNPRDSQFSSVAKLRPTLQPHELQHARPPCPTPIPGVHPNSCPLSQWCHPAISSSVVPFSSCPQSFPASRSFPMSQFSASGGQNIGVSASTSDLPMNTQDWSPWGWTGWISLQSKGLSKSSPTPHFKIISSLVLSFLYSPTLTSIHDYWKNHSLD